MREISINSTKDQILEFKSSILWRDMVIELNSWKKGFKNELLSMVDNIATNNPNTPAVLTHLGDINGRIKAVDYILRIPDIFLQLIEDKNKID